MRIFSIVFILVLIINAQQDSLVIKSIDPLFIEDSLNKIMNAGSDLFISYELESYDSDYLQAIYVKRYHHKTIDSLFVDNNIEINKKITDKILSPYIDTPVGNQYSQVGEKIVKRYYFMTEKPKYNFGLVDNDKLGAIFSFNPQFESVFSGILGINNANSLKFMGELNMHLENISKNAETLDLFWKKTDSTSQIMKFGIFFPHPFSLDMGFDWKYHYEIFNGLYTKSENRVMLHTFIPFFNSFKIGFVKGQTKVTDNGEMNGYEVLSYNAFSVSTQNDSRNNRILPSNGRFTYSIIDGGIDREKLFINSYFKMMSFYSLNDNLSIKLQWMMRGLYYHNYIIPKSRYLIFGGGSTLRGYQEQSFMSTQYQIYTFELIYHQISNFQASYFIDLGALNLNPFSKYIIGSGLGMTQISENYIIKLEYALSNLNLKEGKIHLKWISRI